jgi:bifunctional non-homologous end joining protein LigD
MLRVSKRLNSHYEPGRRSGAWVKHRVSLAQEFVIGGYTPGTVGFDSVVIGFYRPAPPLTRAERAKLPPSRRQYVPPRFDLIYCARVRAGSVAASRRELFGKLKPLARASCPFANLPQAKAGRWGQGLTAEKMAECIWVEPKVVGQFESLEWTAGDQLRHAKFAGLRPDKEAGQVRKEGGSW